MAYKVTTTKSYGNRLTEALKGIAGGFIAFIIGTVILFWNEGNFVKTKKSIKEAEGALVIVDNVSNLDPSLSGNLIHASAFANTEDILVDEMFGIQERAISINRLVEYYQYVEKTHTEKRDKLGGGEETITTYTYEKKWVTEPVPSGSFADPDYQSANSVLKVIEPKAEYAQNVTFGAYMLPAFMITQISGSIPLPANIEPEEGVHVSGNMVYIGQSSASPQIGDVRVTLTKVMPANISIIGKVVSNTFEQFRAKNGKTFSRVAMGTVSSETMFAEAHQENSAMTWMLRLFGILMVIGGLKMMFSIVPTLLKVLPFLGKIVEAGIALICIVGGGAWSIVIIALAWLFYRPLIGIPMLLVAGAGIWYLRKIAAEKKAAKAALQPAETENVTGNE